MKHDHTNCYRNPLWIPIAIFVFIGTLAVSLFAMLGEAFLFAFYFAWMFMAKDDDYIRKKWNKICDDMKFSRGKELVK